MKKRDRRKRTLLHLDDEKARSVHFSSQTDEWTTPQWLFDALNAEFGFSRDACSTDENAKCTKYFTKREDGLSQDWGEETVFMNPPYGRAIASWMKKAYESTKNGALVVCLVPARTDTAWFHQYAMRGTIRFFRGRLRFGDAKNSAPFPSALVVFYPRGHRLEAMDLNKIRLLPRTP